MLMSESGEKPALKLSPGIRAFVWAVPIGLAISAVVSLVCWWQGWGPGWYTHGWSGSVWFLLYLRFQKQAKAHQNA